MSSIPVELTLVAGRKSKVNLLYAAFMVVLTIPNSSDYPLVVTGREVLEKFVAIHSLIIPR